MGRRTRGIVAALLTVVLASGLGHAYLRRWRRAVGWFVVTLSVGVALMMVFVMPEVSAETMAKPFAEQVRIVSSDVPSEVTLPLAALRFLAAADAYRIAVYPPVRSDEGDGQSCPNCRGELDEGLDFCPWCAEPLTGRPREERERSIEH